MTLNGLCVTCPVGMTGVLLVYIPRLKERDGTTQQVHGRELRGPGRVTRRVRARTTGRAVARPGPPSRRQAALDRQGPAAAGRRGSPRHRCGRDRDEHLADLPDRKSAVEGKSGDL